MTVEARDATQSDKLKSALLMAYNKATSLLDTAKQLMSTSFDEAAQQKNIAELESWKTRITQAYTTFLSELKDEISPTSARDEEKLFINSLDQLNQSFAKIKSSNFFLSSNFVELQDIEKLLSRIERLADPTIPAIPAAENQQQSYWRSRWNPLSKNDS